MPKKKHRRHYQERPAPETPPQAKRFVMVLSALALTSIAGLVMLGTEHLRVFWYPKSYKDTLYVLLYAICLLMICLWTLYVTNEFLGKRKGRKWESQLSVKLTKAMYKCTLWLCGFACAVGASSLAMFFARINTRYSWRWYHRRDHWNEPSSWCWDWCFALFIGLFVITCWAIEVCRVKTSKRVKNFLYGEPKSKWFRRLPWWIRY